MSMGCPCGRVGTFGGVLAYQDCCGRYLDDAATPAPDAESLMRSRYTAYVRGRVDYVRATWDAAHRPARLDPDPTVQWLGLRVLEHQQTGDTAQVSFVARFREGSQGTHELRERSRFTRRRGRWYYVDGDLG